MQFVVMFELKLRRWIVDTCADMYEMGGACVRLLTQQSNE